MLVEESPAEVVPEPPRAPQRRRPHLLLEAVLVAGAYLGYSAVRNARGTVTPAKTRRAMADAEQLIRFERRTWMYHERSIQHFLLHAPDVIRGLDVFYATAHFVVTLIVLVWLYRWNPGDYRLMRTTLGVATVLALVGFALYPVMPPRSLPPGRGFVDTLQTYGGLWSFKTPVIERISDPFAAFPSLHLAWASWCSVAVRRSLKNRWGRVLVFAYPAISALTVVGTANHYIIDILAGLALTVIGYWVATLAADWRSVLRWRRPATAGLLESSGTADVAQLVEHHLAKVRVAGSNPVVRSQ
jgi:PAP2 superfamily